MSQSTTDFRLVFEATNTNSPRADSLGEGGSIYVYATNSTGHQERKLFARADVVELHPQPIGKKGLPVSQELAFSLATNSRQRILSIHF